MVYTPCVNPRYMSLPPVGGCPLSPCRRYGLLLEEYIKDPEERDRLLRAIETIPCIGGWVGGWKGVQGQGRGRARARRGAVMRGRSLSVGWWVLVRASGSCSRGGRHKGQYPGGASDRGPVQVAGAPHCCPLTAAAARPAPPKPPARSRQGGVGDALDLLVAQLCGAPGGVCVRGGHPLFRLLLRHLLAQEEGAHAGCAAGQAVWAWRRGTGVGAGGTGLEEGCWRGQWHSWQKRGACTTRVPMAGSS